MTRERSIGRGVKYSLSQLAGLVSTIEHYVTTHFTSPSNSPSSPWMVTVDPQDNAVSTTLPHADVKLLAQIQPLVPADALRIKWDASRPPNANVTAPRAQYPSGTDDKAAQSVLVNALTIAEAYYASNRSYSGCDATVGHSSEPTLSWVDAMTTLAGAGSEVGVEASVNSIALVAASTGDSGCLVVFDTTDTSRPGSGPFGGTTMASFPSQPGTWYGAYKVTAGAPTCTVAHALGVGGVGAWYHRFPGTPRAAAPPGGSLANLTFAHPPTMPITGSTARSGCCGSIASCTAARIAPCAAPCGWRGAHLHESKADLRQGLLQGRPGFAEPGCHAVDERAHGVGGKSRLLQVRGRGGKVDGSQLEQPVCVVGYDDRRRRREDLLAQLLELGAIRLCGPPRVRSPARRGPTW